MNKTFGNVAIKSADQGLVEAVIATLGVVDSDGDVTQPGAFEDGAPLVISSYGHTSWTGGLPVGKGVIRVSGDEARMEGQFFLDTVAGREAFAVAKGLGELGQWSYGYDPVKFSYGEHDGKRVRFLEQLKVHEASQVLVGAGVNTRTVGTKADMRFGDEAEAVLTALTALVDRAADVMAKRQEKGKHLGAESRDLLERIEAQLKRFPSLLEEPVDHPDEPNPLEREWLRSLSRQYA